MNADAKFCRIGLPTGTALAERPRTSCRHVRGAGGGRLGGAEGGDAGGGGDGGGGLGR